MKTKGLRRERERRGINDSRFVLSTVKHEDETERDKLRKKTTKDRQTEEEKGRGKQRMQMKGKRNDCRYYNYH